MGSWTSIALARVSKEAVTDALAAEGLAWASAAHVTATTTLAQAVRSTGVVGLPIATLLDLVVMPGLPGQMALPLTGFPGPAELAAGSYDEDLEQWQSQATGRRMRTAIQADDSLRAFVRQQHPHSPAARALLASRREYARTVHTLVASGVDPAGLQAHSEVGQLAAQAWSRAEQEVEALGAPRGLLWADFDEVAHQSTPSARDLVGRVRAALRAAFGQQDRWMLVHHGFYFYTPPQWALFQVMRRIPDVDQVFVVHDDGANPLLSTWRHYFRGELSMPVPQARPCEETVTPAAAALHRSATGQALGQVPAVQVRECRSPADLVRLWRQEDESGQPPTRYAAAAKDVERYVQRLGRGTGQVAPRLAELPVGTFLMALHRCIQQSPAGTTSVRLDGDTLMDVACSGFLDLPADQPPVAPAVLRRCLPYFWGCRTGDDWLERAGRLRRAVEEKVLPLGARSEGDDDLERITAAAHNPTRLVPWADLSAAQAQGVQATVGRVIELVREVSQHERVALRKHLGFVRERLDRSLRLLPAQEQAAITAKIRGFDVAADDEIDVGGLVDVVAMLLGRSADVDPRDDSEDPSGAVKQLRALDALGLMRARGNLHLANLAEDAYPTTSSPVGWPYTVEDLRRSHEAVEPVTAELFSLRSSTAALGDLYLFWLALDGVEEGSAVTLSWVSDQLGERRRLSPIVSLLTVPNVRSQAVQDAAGGLSVDQMETPAALLAAQAQQPAPSATHVDVSAVAAVLAGLDPQASASAVACPRRFAIQWAMGPTASFGPGHLQSMLYGNVTNALQRLGLDSSLTAYARTGEVWGHLTEGQKRSSIDRAVVKPGRPSADPAWLQSLSGLKQGTSSLDRSYQAATYKDRIKVTDISPMGAGYLPEGVGDPAVCSSCPVQSRCSQRQERTR